MINYLNTKVCEPREAERSKERERERERVGKKKQTYFEKWTKLGKKQVSNEMACLRINYNSD